MKIITLFIIFVTDIFAEISGNIKYYYIETNKNFINKKSKSAHSNAIGAQIKYRTNILNNLHLNATLMTTQPFLLTNKVESSTIGQDNGFMNKNHADNFSILGEAYIEYHDSSFNSWIGRKVITTPMIGAKDVRMLPSSIQGFNGTMQINEEVEFSISYIDHFKQRSSKDFTNIITHALGSDTESIIGNSYGYTISLSLDYRKEYLDIKLYNLYASNFFNTLYSDISFKKDFYSISAQVVYQSSIGNAEHNLAKTSSITKGKKINSAGIGIQGILKKDESTFELVYRNIFTDNSSYDSIITPWDGTLLYAYSSTTNNLGQSLYGNGLTSGGAYVGGTQGVKIGYTQKYNFIGLNNFKTHLAYARYSNSRYRENQDDLKAIIQYNSNNFMIQLKGIWIDNDTYTYKDGTVNQLDFLTQYHVIVNYKF